MKNINSDIVVAILIFMSLFLIHVIIKSKRPLIKTITGIVPGIVTLTGVNLFSAITSVSIPVSILSMGISAVAGIPGVTLLLLLNLI